MKETHGDASLKSPLQTIQEYTPIDIPGNWLPENIETIRTTFAGLLAEKSSRAAAIFDFDNTCIFRDIGKAVFRYQLLHLRYRIHPDIFHSLLPAGDFNLAGIPLKVIVEQLGISYQTLWPFIKQNDLQSAKSLPEYQQFTTLMLWFTTNARKQEELGPLYSLPLSARLLAGYSIDEVKDLTRETIRAVESEPLTTRQCEANLPAPIGPLVTSYELGIHIHPEIHGLIEEFNRNGVPCYIISASTEWIAKAAAHHFGFAIPEDNIFGIRVKLAEQNLSVETAEDHPITYRQGKAAVIGKYIAHSPGLIAGDADTDYEMLTLPEVPIRLIINCNHGGLIGSLYNDANFLLQGMTSSTGRFRPSRETTPT